MPPIFANSPFDKPEADIIIRSCDGVLFCVRSAILEEASPIFFDMFLLPLPPRTDTASDDSDYVNGKPVVDVEETSRTLDHLLRFCYPVLDPIVTELTDVRLVLAAALKYEMEEVIFLMKGALELFIQDQALAVWAIAYTLRLEKEVVEAAKALIGKKFPLTLPPEFSCVTAAAYFRLAQYLEQKGVVEPTFKFWEPSMETVPEQRSPAFMPMTYISRPYADIICRASDGTEFRSHKIILMLASPVLKERIEHGPESASEADTSHNPIDTLPIINFDIVGTVLGPVLELCYPTDIPDFTPTTDALHHVMSIIDCACKLGMNSVLEKLKGERAFKRIAAHLPVASYLLPASMKFTDCAAFALNHVTEQALYVYIPELETTSSLVYHELLHNWRRSSGAYGNGTLADGLRRVLSTTSPRWPRWQSDVLRKMDRAFSSGSAMQLRDAKPDVQLILKETLKQGQWCHTCEKNVNSILRLQRLHDKATQCKAFR